MQFLSVPLRKKRCQVNRHTVLILEILKHEKKRCQNWEGASGRGDWSPGESSGPSSGGPEGCSHAPSQALCGLGGPAGRRPASHAALGDRGGPRTLVQRMFHTRSHPALQPEATRCLARGKPGPVPT